MSKLRIGLIGAGRWGGGPLLRNLARHCDIAWVCDGNAEARQRAHDAGYVACDAPMWSECEAVAIATPIDTHADIVADALIHEKHVLCEKPLATSAWVARVFAKYQHRVVMMSAPWLFHPAIQRAGEVAKDLGAPLWFRAARTSWDERDLDPIADLLPHDVGILRAWTGQEVAEVGAVREGPTASVTLRTSGGVVGTVQYTYRDRGKQRRTELGCAGGWLGVDDGVLFHEKNGGSFTYGHDDAGPEPLDAMCAEFVAGCREGRAPRYGNVDDALAVAAVIEAAHRSVSERRVVGL